MVRLYKVRGEKREKKEENYDKEEIEEPTVLEKRAKIEEHTAAADTEAAERVVDLLSGIPVVAADQSTNKPGSYQLLNSDEHSNFLKKNGRNPSDYRPIIAHQAMLSILDSRVNKAGRLKALYVRTEKGVLFEVKPHVRIPRTFKRFAGIMCKLNYLEQIFFTHIMLSFPSLICLIFLFSDVASNPVQLLQKLSITAVGKREKLLRVIKNPVTQYPPIDCQKIGFSHSSEKLVDIQDYVNGINNDMNLVFVAGAMAHGKIDKDYVEDYLTISDYPLSAAYCISMITNSVERKWKIL
ncbi:hypothetical protein RND71_016329 [Anisodus tanguticus]|uniref:Ribosomal RNA small subunit methyltransferase NEP1 n=1 Tax=Anisodus tanguticus TaxID=243964 RepID=A0AAE1S9M7_9SOLA|nr:hypothetical protein RND71_016329 [Anisodus tanguticus]